VKSRFSNIGKEEFTDKAEPIPDDGLGLSHLEAKLEYDQLSMTVMCVHGLSQAQEQLRRSSQTQIQPSILNGLNKAVEALQWGFEDCKFTPLKSDLALATESIGTLIGKGIDTLIRIIKNILRIAFTFSKRILSKRELLAQRATGLRKKLEAKISSGETTLSGTPPNVGTLPLWLIALSREDKTIAGNGLSKIYTDILAINDEIRMGQLNAFSYKTDKAIIDHFQDAVKQAEAPLSDKDREELKRFEVVTIPNKLGVASDTDSADGVKTVVSKELSGGFSIKVQSKEVKDVASLPHGLSHFQARLTKETEPKITTVDDLDIETKEALLLIISVDRRMTDRSVVTSTEQLVDKVKNLNERIDIWARYAKAGSGTDDSKLKEAQSFIFSLTKAMMSKYVTFAMDLLKYEVDLAVAIIQYLDHQLA